MFDQNNELSNKTATNKRRRRRVVSIRKYKVSRDGTKTLLSVTPASAIPKNISGDLNQYLKDSKVPFKSRNEARSKCQTDVQNNRQKSYDIGVKDNLSDNGKPSGNLLQKKKKSVSKVSDTFYDERTQTTKKIIIKTIKRSRSRRDKQNLDPNTSKKFRRTPDMPPSSALEINRQESEGLKQSKFGTQGLALQSLGLNAPNKPELSYAPKNIKIGQKAGGLITF